MTFSRNLRDLRVDRFLSQRELARRAGLHPATLTRRESEATAPSSRTVRGLADALGLKPGDLTTPDEVAELRRAPRVPEQSTKRGLAMHDFAAQIGASVRTARELRRAHTDALRRKEEGAARRLKEAQQQASALVVTAWERISTAAQASDGALKADRSEQQGVATFVLRWTEDPPARALQIRIDQADGTIQAAWILPPGYGRSVDAPNVPAHGFDLSTLESAILLLVEQRRWGHNAIPSIPW